MTAHSHNHQRVRAAQVLVRTKGTARRMGLQEFVLQHLHLFAFAFIGDLFNKRHMKRRQSLPNQFDNTVKFVIRGYLGERVIIFLSKNVDGLMKTVSPLFAPKHLKVLYDTSASPFCIVSTDAPRINR